MNETTIIAFSDEKLLLNARTILPPLKRRIATSTNGGKTWRGPFIAEDLNDPFCEAGLLSYDAPGPRSSKALEPRVILFSNPNDLSRKNMSVRMSENGGETWPIARVVYPGSSAYSSLAKLAGGTIGLAYEADDYTRIAYAHFSIAWLREPTGR
jgi:sialidase-1